MKKLSFLPSPVKIIGILVVVFFLVSLIFVSGGDHTVQAFSRVSQFIHAAFSPTGTYCYTDSDGVNDEPGQKDVTKACVDTTTADPLHISWNWDIISLSGNNSADACALFDTDMDGFANYSVCNSWKGTPPVQIAGYPVIYSCSDTRSDRCAGGVPGPITSSSCSIVNDRNNPPTFPWGDPWTTGDSYPYDTGSECTISMADVGFPVYPVTLLDVCSYPSLQPNSDPSDCVITSDDLANLEIRKNVVPDDTTTNWRILVAGPSPFTDILVGDDTTANRTVIPGTYTITEEAGLNTSLAGYTSTWVCTESSGSTVRTINGTGTTISNLSMTTGEIWDCTFTNTSDVDLTVTKSDTIDFSPFMKVVNLPFPYVISISHAIPTETSTAFDVSLVDTLDPWLDYLSDQAGYPYTVKLNGIALDPQPVCTYTDTFSNGRGGTFTCANIGDLAPGSVFTVTFWASAVTGVFTTGSIEDGICTQGTSTTPGTQGGTPVDICNIVTVSTTSVDSNLSNNADSEPGNMNSPTAVDLSWFDITRRTQKAIILGWETASESNVLGFNLYRSRTAAPTNLKLIAGNIPAANPGQMMGAVYKFKDVTARPAKVYYYWLETIDTGGEVELVGPVKGALKP